MATPRIGKRELVVAGKSTPPPRPPSVMALALASPFGILLVFPSLVVAVGVLLTISGHAALRGSNLRAARESIHDQAELVASNLRQALEQADPMLAQLTEIASAHAPSDPIEPTAGALRDLLRGRPGAAYTSISYPDGTFQGAYIDRDGTLRFNDSRIDDWATHVKRYDYSAHASLTLHSEERSAYDPRQRDFYKLASSTDGARWTAPYPFYKSHYTGISRTRGVFSENQRGERQLKAVVTVDFNVNELSALLAKGQLHDMRALLFTRDGTLLAYPNAADAIASMAMADRTLNYHDLHDGVLEAFFAVLPRTGQPTPLISNFTLAGERFLAAAAPVNRDPTLGWYVGYIAPERTFLSALEDYGRRSILVSVSAVLVSMALAFAFARLIVRVRREANAARAEAHEARREMRELGSYRLVQCLGHGGMGEVWRAEHRLLAREAAIKLIRLEEGADSVAEAQERFRREAQTLATLRSRNTIELFDFGVADDGTFFYVMELLDGLDLESLVQTYGPQPPARVISLLLQACNSLAEAHDAGLVHRDIKPANLFVCRAADEVDVIKVLDFGLVRSLVTEKAGEESPLSLRGGASDPHAGSISSTKLTQTGYVMGTPDFMAPEQALGYDTDGRSDIYALACVAVWLLSGRVLFKRDNPMQLLIAQIREAPPPLSQLIQALPPELETLLDECLAKRAQQRPQDARELARRLRAIVLPPAERWTDEAAQRWWAEKRPRPRSSLHPVAAAS